MSPKKMREVAREIQGMPAPEALALVTLVPRKSARLIAKTLKSAGQGGMGLKLDPWYLETELATANQLFVNNSNGRTTRASAAVFDNSTGTQVFTDLNDMVSSGTACTHSVAGAGA